MTAVQFAGRIGADPLDEDLLSFAAVIVAVFRTGIEDRVDHGSQS